MMESRLPGLILRLLVLLSLEAAGIFLLVVSCQGPDVGHLRVETTRSRMREVSSQIEHFKLNHGRYPFDLRELRQRPPDIPITGWPTGGYLKRDPEDAWSRPLIFDRTTHMLMSLGRDGVPGGEGEDADLRECLLRTSP